MALALKALPQRINIVPHRENSLELRLLPPTLLLLERSEEIEVVLRQELEAGQEGVDGPLVLDLKAVRWVEAALFAAEIRR